MNYLKLIFAKVKVEDVFRKYQDKEKNKYVQIEILDFEPSNKSWTVESKTGWSGSIPNGTYSLRPSKVYGAYNYSFKMTVTIDGVTAISRSFSLVTDYLLIANQPRKLKIMTW